jgi:uncharacterized protein YjbI with pentapeptide repeats
MAVGSGIPFNVHTGTGAATVFAYSFTLLDAGDLVVTLAGVPTTSYTVAGIGNAGGGSITFSAAPADGAEVILRRVIALVRETDYQNNGDLLAPTLNGDFDRLWMAVQQAEDGESRSLRAPFPDSIDELPAESVRAGRLLAFDAASGQPRASTFTETEIASAVAASYLAGSTADAVAYVPSGFGAVARSVQHALRDRVCVFDFMTSAQVADVLAGTLSLDVSAAIQAAVQAVESDGIGLARRLYFPGGRYRLGAAITFAKQYVTVEGDGMFSTQFHIQGATDGFACQAGLTYWRPTLRGFAILGGLSSLHALNMSGAGTVYNGEISSLYLVSNGAAFYGGPTTIMFSNQVQNVVGGSTAGHFIHTNNGPSQVFRGCYGFFAGPGKALYRMAGNVHLDACNGGNDPGYDWWGIFGNDTSSADGWQADFTTADYADVNLVGCNVEYFASRAAGVGGGLRFQTQLRGFRFEGGKFDRAALSTGYEAVIYARAGMNGDVTPFVLEPAWFQPGAGTPSAAHLYSASLGGAQFVDGNGQLAAGGVTTCKLSSQALPTLKRQMVGDVYLGMAMADSAISPRRLSVQIARYKTKTVAPVGTNQTVDATGVTKLLVTPAASASIKFVTFDDTAGADLDHQRNGRLLIEATNANVRIEHTARGGGAKGIILSGGAGINLVAGQVVECVYSETSGMWQQV